MTRTSTFAVATLAAIAAASLAPTGAFARFSGGSFAVGFSGPVSPGAGHISAPGGSSVIARLPVGSAKTGGHRISATTPISKLPPYHTTVKDPDHNKPWPKRPPRIPGGVLVDVPVGIAVGVVSGADSQAVQTAQPNCNCLTKQYLDDGSLLFRDICSKEAALATPDELKAQAQNQAR